MLALTNKIVLYSLHITTAILPPSLLKLYVFFIVTNKYCHLIYISIRANIMGSLQWQNACEFNTMVLWRHDTIVI